MLYAGGVLMPPDTNCRVVRCAEGVDLHRISAGIRDVVWSEADLLKVTRGSAVLRAKVAGVDSVAKVMPIGGFKRRLQAILGRTQGDRTFRCAEKLMQAQIRVAEPLVLIRGKHEGRRVECLLMRAAPGQTLLELIASNDLTASEEHRVARAVGRQLKALVEAKLFNRDHKPSNLIVTGPGVQPAMVDTVAILPAPARMRALKRMLEALVTEPTGLGRPPRRTLAMRTIRSAVQTKDEARRLYVEVARAVRAKRDIRPKHNPLARPLAG